MIKSIKLIGISLLILLSIPVFANNLAEFSGSVIEKSNKKPLPGAIITIPEIKATAITDQQGNFIFRSIPDRGKFVVEVKFIGFKTITRTIDFSVTSEIQFELETTVLETEEVVVTGTAISADNKRNSTSVAALNHDQLLNQPSSNIVDAITLLPGVSQITTGPAISKPVIRGLGYNRIVTLSDGLKQQGQQWGDEHGIEIDQYSADRVEVLRGAASLLYGSDALGGVINILDPLPVAEGAIKGELLTNYASNNGLTGSSLMLTGNNNGLVWRARGSYKNAYAYKTPEAYVPNSGFNETSFSGMVGFNKSWGFSHLNFSSFHNNIGFYEPEVNDEGQFVDEDGLIFSSSQLKSRKLAFPQQRVRHYKVSLNNNIMLGSAGYIKADLGFQNNQRQELESAEPELFFDLNTYSGDFKYFMLENNGWQPVLGLNMERGVSVNKGEEYLIPDYSTFGIGFFTYLKKSWERSTINAGLRYDFKKNKGKGLVEDDEIRFEPFNNKFSNLSGALGFTYEFNDHFNFKANAGSAFRAPNPIELGANGVHEGAFRYEMGKSDLKPERSYQADIYMGYGNKLMDLGLGLFNNYITDFIYASNNGRTELVDGDLFPVYEYGQVNSNFYGVEVNLILHPSELLHLENTYSYTRAENTTQNKPLPFIPAGTLRNELRFEPKLKGLQSSYMAIGIDSYFAQKRVDAQFETPSAGYTLFNASLGTTVKWKNQPVKFYLAGTNLLNKKYYNHLSRFKPGRLDDQNPEFGIYNVGRNLTLGLQLPLSL
jgi:iron complex outermembrane receptor protein